MKQLLTILLLAICTAVSYNTEAQDYHRNITGTLDTLDNTEADTTIVTISGYKRAVTFQHNVTKISGTVAGTIILYGTVDTSASPVWVTLKTDSLTDGTHVHTNVLTTNSWKKYRIIKTGIGTQSSSHRTYLLYRE